MKNKLALEFLLCLFAALATPVVAGDVLQEITQTSPKFFPELFDRELYILSKINKYDELCDKQEIGDDLNENYNERLTRLQNRKKHWVTIKLIKRLDDYEKEVSATDWNKIKRTLCDSGVAGVTTGGALKVFAQKTAQASAAGGIGGALFKDLALFPVFYLALSIGIFLRLWFFAVRPWQFLSPRYKSDGMNTVFFVAMICSPR